jgi:hypothetical protein
MPMKPNDRVLNKNGDKPRQVTLENPKNSELWLCDDFTKRRHIDGVEFVEVHQPDSLRKLWINLSTVVVKKARKQ